MKLTLATTAIITGSLTLLEYVECIPHARVGNSFSNVANYVGATCNTFTQKTRPCVNLPGNSFTLVCVPNINSQMKLVGKERFFHGTCKKKITISDGDACASRIEKNPYIFSCKTGSECDPMNGCQPKKPLNEAVSPTSEAGISALLAINQIAGQGSRATGRTSAPVPTNFMNLGNEWKISHENGRPVIRPNTDLNSPTPSNSNSRPIATPFPGINPVLGISNTMPNGNTASDFRPNAGSGTANDNVAKGNENTDASSDPPLFIKNFHK